MAEQWGKRARHLRDDRDKGLAAKARSSQVEAPKHPAVSDLLDKQRAGGNRATSRSVVQTKLTVGPAGDRHERQADKVAGDVMRNLNRQPVQRQEEEELQMKPLVQRQEEEEELMMKRAERVVGMEGGSLDADTDSRIQQAKGRGRPLDDNLRSSMEGAFGTDFSKVRVHDDDNAHDTNRALQAKAFTTGSDIFFRQGDYNPSTESGQRLVAHELTHVVQQGGGSAKVQRARTLPGREHEENLLAGGKSSDAYRGDTNAGEMPEMEAMPGVRPGAEAAEQLEAGSADRAERDSFGRRGVFGDAHSRALNRAKATAEGIEDRDRGGRWKRYLGSIEGGLQGAGDEKTSAAMMDANPLRKTSMKRTAKAANKAQTRTKGAVDYMTERQEKTWLLSKLHQKINPNAREKVVGANPLAMKIKAEDKGIKRGAKKASNVVTGLVTRPGQTVAGLRALANTKKQARMEKRLEKAGTRAFKKSPHYAAAKQNLRELQGVEPGVSKKALHGYAEISGQKLAGKATERWNPDYRSRAQKKKTEAAEAKMAGKRGRDIEDLRAQAMAEAEQINAAQAARKEEEEAKHQEHAEQ
jgi:hypothetical protein